MHDQARCPACTAPDLEINAKGRFFCLYCGSQFVNRCPSCNHENAASAENCVRCGEPLTTVAAVLGRHEFPGPPLWLRQTRSRANSLKELEEHASESRMAALKGVDDRRKERIAISEAKQRIKDRQVVRILFLSAGMFLVVVVVITLLSYIVN